MLAQVTIELPFFIVVSTTAEFPISEYQEGDYRVRVLPPNYTEETSATAPDMVTIDAQPAVMANQFRVDFYKESFDRAKGGPVDPPIELIAKTLESFLTRFRYVTRAHNVRLPDFPRCNWHVEYRNDDGTKLNAEPGLVTKRGALPVLHVTVTSLTPEIWQSVNGLTAYEPPPWDALLLDAQAELPAVGTAIVLAATALEVFIAVILDQLALEHSLPSEVWSWINKREDYRQQPSVQEQYDVLLKVFTGHSLKDDALLWDSFKELKQVRNRFVHEGLATANKKGKTPISAQRARELVSAAQQIVSKVREWLPEILRWPVFNHTATLEITSKPIPTGV
jgi:hypothetical protein